MGERLTEARRWVRSAVLATVLAPTGWAHADDPPPSPVERRVAMPARVDYVRPNCSPMAFDEQNFIRLLRIELANDGVSDLQVRESASPPGPRGAAVPGDVSLAVMALDNACSADGTLTIEIDDAATAKRVERSVELGGVPAAGRARVLALAAAELLRASWAELVLPDAPAASVPVPLEVKRATQDRVRRAVSESVRRGGDMPSAASEPPPEGLIVMASPEARFFVDERLAMAGLRLGPSMPLGARSPLRLRVHLVSSYGTGAATGGNFDAWLVATGAGIMAGHRWRRAALELGPQFEAGWGWRRLRSEGSAPAGDSDGVMAAFSIVGSGRVHLGGRWWSIADLEIGQAAGSDGVASTGSTSVGARLGVAISP